MKTPRTDLNKLIKDESLKASLDQIKLAASKIWAEIRIVHNYTEHGPEHSKRLQDYAAAIVTANDGQRLTPEEAYLLLSGIHLHDIGMQCDVRKFPDIKKCAEEKFGAQFTARFTTKTSSSFSHKEQNDIRKNHHLLSVAWIDRALSTHDNILHTAAGTIPTHLVEDLLDVCKYHTKFSISECPLTGNANPTIRKRLVAAILRFSDELDVAADRVTLETYETFSLEPKNAVYWWLHGQSLVTFQKRNLILINVGLNPDDAAAFKDLIQTKYIDGLKTKNAPVITELAYHEIPLVISHNSTVVMSSGAKRILPEFVKALKEGAETLPRTAVMESSQPPVVSLIDLCDIAVNNEKKVDLLLKLSHRLEESGRVEEAGSCLEVAQKLLSASRKKNWEKTTHIALARALQAYRSAKFEEAIRLGKEATKVALNIKDKTLRLKMQISSLINTAFTTFLAGNRLQALSILRQADAIPLPRRQRCGWVDNYRIFELLVADAERVSWLSSLGTEIDKVKLEAAKKAIDDIQQRFSSIRLPKQNRKAMGIDYGLYHLIWGRLALYSAQCFHGPGTLAQMAKARDHIKAAMSTLGLIGKGLRPVCLESRAWLRMVNGDRNGSREDLNEALAIATQGSMVAHKIDILLYRTRLFSDTTPYPWGSLKKDLATVRQLIHDCGYWRRKQELKDFEKAIVAA